MTTTKSGFALEEITVSIPLSQLEEIHEIWLQFASILHIAENDEGSESMLRLLKPRESRMSEVVFEEWETMMDKAMRERREGGSQ